MKRVMMVSRGGVEMEQNVCSMRRVDGFIFLDDFLPSGERCSRLAAMGYGGQQRDTPRVARDGPLSNGRGWADAGQEDERFFALRVCKALRLQQPAAGSHSLLVQLVDASIKQDAGEQQVFLRDDGAEMVDGARFCHDGLSRWCVRNTSHPT